MQPSAILCDGRISFPVSDSIKMGRVPRRLLHSAAVPAEILDSIF